MTGFQARARGRALSLVICLIVGWSELANAQSLRVERDKVLARVGTAETTSIPLGPLLTSPGLAFKQDVSRPGAKSIRLRITVATPSEDWALAVRKPGGAVQWSKWHGEPDAAGSFWTDEIPGSQVSVEVHSTRPHNALAASIDRVLIDIDGQKPVSISGVDQRRPIGQADAWMKTLGRSIGRLRFVSDLDGEAYVCTAFLVSSDLLLTNEHCIATDSERASALVDFDYDEEASPLSALRLSQLITNDAGLDYALVRLARPVDRSPLLIEPSRAQDQLATLIIQHPAGEPKQISLQDCRVAGAVMAGRANTPTDFGHTCDTLGGSSGSPVFNLQTRRVTGLHHLGIPDGGSVLVNRAVHIGRVLDHLPANVKQEIDAP